ncbi:uncharacterized protein LOC125206385 [Salvia hispanica]|uniref:uncharacterized protein LOC125206385 n=1 Tax=Salvia hispanica TaxID=49212 RepID=UPI00200929E5|nr:uncharacterized protein LOC125206385 [Salvia hispanica]
MQFMYVLPGWEGSAGDSRVLRDAVSRPNGLKVPQECAAPGTDAPQNSKELFNLRHTKARNVIERAFAVLKMRWAILRSVAYYPIRTQIRIIMTCFLLHNFVRREMAIDPVEAELDGAIPNVTQDGAFIGAEYVDCIEPTQEWTQTRDNLAMNMWNNR